MVVSTPASAVTYLGNNATMIWPFTFPVSEESWLQVKTKDPTGVLSTISPSEYTVTGIGEAAGGSVAYPKSGPALSSGWRLRIQRVVPILQPTEVVNQEAYFPEIMEASADYKTFIDQQLHQRIIDIESNDFWY